METMPNPNWGPDPGGPPGEGSDHVREPPLPANDGAKDNFPGKSDLIDPDDDGGRIKKKSL